jgi:hypothetical protein
MSGEESRERVAELLRGASELRHGPEQVALVERAVSIADAHQDLELGFAARRRLVQSATFSGMPDKSMVAFAWCLAQSDRDPRRFPEHRVLWQYKWVVMSLYGFPEIPRARIEEAIEDIDVRYRRAGLSLRPIWRIRLISARGMGDEDRAGECFSRWLEAPRDQFTDCRACETSTHVGHLVDLGRDDQALEVARPLLDGRLSCATQPQISLGRVLLPLLRRGRLDEAVERHLQGYRAIRREPHYYTATLAQHLSFLALSGNLDRAVAVLEAHAAQALRDPTPGDRFHFGLAARLVVDALRRAGRDVVAVRLGLGPQADHRGPTPTTDLEQLLAGFLQELAARFDARNGNDFHTRMIGRHAGLAEHAVDHPIRS